jgi:hypothetical protein
VLKDFVNSKETEEQLLERSGNQGREICEGPLDAGREKQVVSGTTVNKEFTMANVQTVKSNL